MSARSKSPDLKAPLAAGDRDVAQKNSNSALTRYETTIDLGSAATAFYFGPLIPSTTSTVEDAYVEVEAAASDRGTCPLTFFAEAPNPKRLDTVTETEYLTSLPRTTATVSWEVPPFTVGETHRTPSLAAIVFEVLASTYFRRNLLLVTQSASSSQFARRITS